MMTSSTSNPVRERCLAYLLGEMSPTQTTAFEFELLDPKVADALAQESRLLCNLAAIERLPLNHSQSSIPSKTAHHSPALSSRRLSHRIRILISALAACTLIAASAVLFMQRDSNENSKLAQMTAPTDAAAFELELAKTWVQPAVDWPADDDDVLAGGEELDPSIKFDEVASEENSEENIDWIVAAVKASISAGERNDG